MKILKRALLTILAVVGLLLVAGLFLPRTYHVERSIVINAKPAEIYPSIGTLTEWPKWTVWNETKYPDMKQEWSTPASGVGAWSKWEGKKSGDGTTKITRADPEKGIAFDLAFNQGGYLSTGELRMEPAGAATKVTWTNDGNMGANPISRYFGLMMDKFMGPDFETGLANLKTKTEAH